MTEERKIQQFHNLIQRRTEAAKQTVRALSSRHDDIAAGTISRIREIGGIVRQFFSARSYSPGVADKIGKLFKEYDKYLKGLELSVSAHSNKNAKMFALWLVQVDEQLAKLF